MANYVLEILDGDRAGEVLPVGGATLRIGRKSGNDIVLADEKTSGVHCEIVPEDDRLVLKDLGSTNGTFLDGKRITEIVLTSGDVVTIGRTKVRFVDQDADKVSASDPQSDEFSLRTLDASRLQKRGSSIGLLAVLLVVVAGGGAWWWFQGRDLADTGGGDGAPKANARSAEPIVVRDNQLPGNLGACETEEGFDLRAGGRSWQVVPDAHSGAGALSAWRASDAEGAGGAAAGAERDYAILQLAEPLEAFQGRTLTLSAHVATRGEAMVALRAVAFDSREGSPFRLVSGTRMQAYAGDYERIETVVTMPTGSDRLQLEVVAVLPDEASEVLVDDLAIVNGGEPNGFDQGVEGTVQTLFGFGEAVAVRSTDVDNPATVLAVVPATPPESMRMLHEDGRLVMSDVGADVRAAVDGTRVELSATGTEALELVFPADATAGLLLAGEDGRFAAAAAEGQLQASRLLLGSYQTRALVVLDQPGELLGARAGGRYRLRTPGAAAALEFGFRQQSLQAAELVRQAEADVRARQPGSALDKLAELVATLPMDSEQLAKAQQLRGELLDEQARRIATLQQDLDQAGFFDTRGGYERVRAGVDDLIEVYGEHNVEGLAEVQGLRTRASDRLAAFDQRTHEPERERLDRLAGAFESANDEKLAQLAQMVRKYIDEHLTGN